MSVRTRGRITSGRPVLACRTHIRYFVLFFRC